MDKHYPHIKPRTNLDRPYLVKMNEGPGWKEAIVLAVIWGLLVGLFALLGIWAISFGLSVVGLV